MFGSDYPHGESLWPNSQPYIENAMAHLSDTTIQKITRDNAAALYRIGS
jgi:predicted TIM-barrel fold metal-dependent hydrolase